MFSFFVCGTITRYILTNTKMDTANTAMEMDAEMGLTGGAANDNVKKGDGAVINFPVQDIWEARGVDEVSAKPGDVVKIRSATGKEIELVFGKMIGKAQVREKFGSGVYNRGVEDVTRNIKKGVSVIIGGEPVDVQEIAYVPAAA